MKSIFPAVKPFLVALVALPVQLAAQGSTPAAPSAGSILQQVQPNPPAAAPIARPRLTIDREGGSALPLSAAFPVKSVRIAGNTLFDTGTLHALVAEAEGKTLTLEQLGGYVACITDYYRAHGYPLAQAMILAQVIQDGVLVIDVIEARYGEITFNNLSRVKGGLLQKTLSSLERSHPIEEDELNHALSLLSEIPGVAVNATLKPGDAVGTSDLQVNAASGRTMSGSATLDTYGSRSTGKLRLSASVNFINPLHHGDVLAINGLSSGRGTNHGRVAYDSLVSGQGTRVGGSYSSLHYLLGSPFASLNAHGTAQLKSLWAKTPLKRGRRINLSGQLQYDALLLRDHIDAGALRIDRHVDHGTVTLVADTRDSFFSGGITTASIGWKTGRVAFDDPAAELSDAVTAGSAGAFSKWNMSIARLQRLTERTSGYLSFAAQWANGNLDASEKMSAGGPSTVRAYDVGAVSGDSGFFGTAELRRDLGVAWNTRWQAVAFFDRAQLTINRNTWLSGANRVALTGAGVGLNIAAPKNWSAKISVATRVGSAPSLGGRTASARGWLELSRGF
ncbi:MAG: ShlB/FhaC/HecB family hemolysin secretion/activation protein [Opitutaceae bacterium]